jgi:serine phosphatase RsbU (regulator of sigma subunit)
VEWLAPDRLYLVIADVAGHGITSSLTMSRISTELQRRLGEDDDLPVVAKGLNEWMRARLGDVRH